jgi:hypothetical protein
LLVAFDEIDLKERNNFETFLVVSRDAYAAGGPAE